MKIDMLDVVLLKDGRVGTVVEIFGDGEAFVIDITDDSKDEMNTPIVKMEEIEKIIYPYKS